MPQPCRTDDMTKPQSSQQEVAGCFEPGWVLTLQLSEAELCIVSAATCISIAATRMQEVKLWRHACPVYHTEHRVACHLPVSQLNLCQKLLEAQGTKALQM